MTYATRPRHISPVYALGEPVEQRDPLEVWGRVEAMRRRAWRDHGIMAIRLAELPDGLRQDIEAWATEQYGRRG